MTGTVRLTVGGQSYTQPMTVKMDPRVSVSQADLEQQLNLGLEISRALQQEFQSVTALKNVAAELKALETKASGELRPEIAELAKRARKLEGSAAPGAPGAGFTRLNETMASLLGSIETADHAPTTQAVAVFQVEQTELEAMLAEWSRLKQQLATLNQKLAQQNLPPVRVP